MTDGASTDAGGDQADAPTAPVGPVQEAAIEVIGAIRAALDLVEDLVRHPPAAPAASGLADLATQLFQAAQPWLASARPDAGGADVNGRPDTGGGADPAGREADPAP